MNNCDTHFNTNAGFGKLPADQFDAEYLRLIKLDLANAQAHRHEMPAVAKRGLTDETIDHFNFGYIPDWINTKSRAELNCGLYVDKKTGKPKHLPPPSERVIIPTASGNHFNAVATQAARADLHKDYWKQHAGEMELFCDPSALEADTILIVEGEWDAASIWQCSGGKIAVVAILGCANWKKTLLPKLDDLRGKRFVLMLDADDAGKKNAKLLCNELLKRGIPAFYRPLYDVLTPHYRQLYGAKVDANDILQARGDKYLNDLIQDDILGDYTVANLNIVAEEIKQGKYVVEDKPATHKEISTPNNGTDPGIDTDEIKLILKDFVHANDLTRDEWWSVGAILYRYGFTLDDFKAWSDDGDSRYNENRCEIEWDCYADEIPKFNDDEGYKIGTLIHFAKQKGYNPPRRKNSADEIDYESLFNGLKPIRACAGSILNVAAANDKTALEEIFCYKDFRGFVKVVTVEHDDGSEREFSGTPYGDGGLMLGDVRFALKWFIVKMYQYFSSDEEAKSFISERLSLAAASGAMQIVNDEQFWESATEIAKNLYHGKIYDFTEKYRRDLIDFAKKHPRFIYSLRRFDYQRLSRFLQQSSFTPVVCAELLIDIQGDFLRFDEQQGTWYKWTKNFWQAIQIKSLAPLYSAWTPLARKIRVFAEIECLRKFCERDDFAINNPDHKQKRTTAAEKYNRLKAAAQTAYAKSTETDMLEDSSSIRKIFDQASGLPEIMIRTSELDRDKYLFNCANVTIDLQTMETYKARQSDLITLSTETVYDPAATSDVWTNFLVSAIPDENLRDWLQRFFGYCLSGDTSEHIFVFIHGGGGSGKTTLLNAIGGAIGDYAQIFSVDAICENKKQKDGDEASPVLAALRACRLARSSETKKNRRLDEAIIKRWTGSDPLPARELYKPQFKFNPSFKIVIDGNFALRVSDINDDGLRRRLRIAPVNNPPPADKIDTKLSDKLSTPQARSAILNWLIEGWRQYQARGLSDKPAVMQTALDNFYNANDVMADFLEALDYQAGNKTNTKYRVPVMDAWQAYQRWQRQTPTASMLSRADFVSAFLKATETDSVELQAIAHKQHFVGCRLNTPETENLIIPPENFM